MKNKKLLATLICCSSIYHVSAGTVAEEIAAGFPGVNDLFTQLAHVQGSMASAKSDFQRQNVLMSEFDSSFQERLNVRQSTYNCILEKYQGLVAALSTCNTNKEQIIKDLDLDRRILQGQIEDLRLCTEQEISILQNDVSVLTSQIEQIKADYASMSNMSTENVDDAVVKLQAIQTDYADMVTTRTQFISNLDSLLAKLKRFESLEKDDTAAIKQAICN